MNRLYHSLFVYTVGYFEVVRSIVKGYMREDGNKGVYISKIWRVFMILLEYACKTDYQMITSQLEKDHHDKVNEMELKYKTEIDKLELSEARQKAEARELR